MKKVAGTRAALAGLMLVLAIGAWSCGAGEDAKRDTCSEGCADLTFFDCVDGSVVKECNDECAVQPISIVEDYNACAEVGGICAPTACLDILGVDAEGREVESATDQFQRDRCKDGCNEAASCSDTSTTADCLDACDTVSVSDAEVFGSCVRITNDCLENVECYTTLGI